MGVTPDPDSSCDPGGLVAGRRCCAKNSCRSRASSRERGISCPLSYSFQTTCTTCPPPATQLVLENIRSRKPSQHCYSRFLEMDTFSFSCSLSLNESALGNHPPRAAPWAAVQACGLVGGDVPAWQVWRGRGSPDTRAAPRAAARGRLASRGRGGAAWGAPRAPRPRAGRRGRRGGACPRGQGRRRGRGKVPPVGGVSAHATRGERGRERGEGGGEEFVT